MKTMSLKILLVLMLGLLFLLLGLALFATGLANTHGFLQRQLHAHAQETATTLALELSPALASNDTAAVANAVDALYDSGYYRRIAVIRPNGESVVERELPLKVDGAPEWFISRVPFDAPAGRAESMAGWKLSAVVDVASHPGFGYSQLWQMTWSILGWTLGFWLISALLSVWLLQKALRPLDRLENLALRIGEGKFEPLAELPRIRELHHIGSAFNRMSEAVRRMLNAKMETIEKLQRDLHHDRQTGLFNRAYFLASLDAALAISGTQHAIAILQLTGLAECNRRFGRDTGDLVVKFLADVVEAVAEKTHGSAARIDGAQFAVLLEHADADCLNDLTHHLAQSTVMALLETGIASSCTVHIGAALSSGDSSTALLARADAALRDAQMGSSGSFRIAEADPTPGGSGRLALLRQALDNGQVELERQPLMCRNASAPEHYEVFARIVTENGLRLSAGALGHIAEETDLAPMLDKLVVARLQEAMAEKPEAAWSVNLSVATIMQPGFAQSFRHKVPARSNLAIEVPLNRLILAPQAAESVSELRRDGFRFVLDRFMPYPGALAWLNELMPDWVKVEGALCRRIFDDAGNQALLKALCQYARELGIRVAATGVEREDEADLLFGLGFDAVQGRVFEKAS